LSKITNDDLTRSDRMLYSCTHMATVGVKGLTMCSPRILYGNCGMRADWSSGVGGAVVSR